MMAHRKRSRPLNGAVLFIYLFIPFSKCNTKECEIGSSYYDRIQDDCVACGIYPATCNAIDKVTLDNCLKNCSKFIFLVKWCYFMVFII